MLYMALWHSPEHHIIVEGIVFMWLCRLGPTLFVSLSGKERTWTSLLIYISPMCCQHVTVPNTLWDIDHTNDPEYHVIVETTLWLTAAAGNRWRSICQAYMSGFIAQIVKRILTLNGVIFSSRAGQKLRKLCTYVNLSPMPELQMENDQFINFSIFLKRSHVDANTFITINPATHITYTTTYREREWEEIYFYWGLFWACDQIITPKTIIGIDGPSPLRCCWKGTGIMYSMQNFHRTMWFS